jgi:hypothetical protein
MLHAGQKLEAAGPRVGHPHSSAGQGRDGALSEMKTNDELIAEQLRTDPEFRVEWERTALARAAGVAIVRYPPSAISHSVSLPSASA